MGHIRNNVLDRHLEQYPDEESWLRQFLNGFDVTWGTRLQRFNADISVYILDPEPGTRDTFGFEHEILLVYSPYQQVQDRDFQAADAISKERPYSGRVETHLYILVSRDDNVFTFTQDKNAIQPSGVVAVPFSTQQLTDAAGDAWFVRNALRGGLFARNLFDIRRPVSSDAQFFGRREVVLALCDSLKRGESRGLFGLRKTGKTSVLFRVKLKLEETAAAAVVFINGEGPEYYQQRWWELLHTIVAELQAFVGARAAHPYTAAEGAMSFARDIAALLPSLPGRRAVVLIDELEYLSPPTAESKHWEQDFALFWRVLRSANTKLQGFSVLAAGCNPTIVESSTIPGTSSQNPIFSLLPITWMPPLPLEDVRSLARTLSRRMGIHFAEDCYSYFHERYGGHALLVRLACSWVHQELDRLELARPCDVPAEWLENTSGIREAELEYYCDHILQVLEHFYPRELALLEEIALSDPLHHPIVLKRLTPDAKHLRDYRMVRADMNGHYTITIPVVEDYLKSRNELRNTAATHGDIVPLEDRASWVTDQVRHITGAIRYLDKILVTKNLPLLAGIGGLPEADKFVNLVPINDEAGFGQFINVANRCLVEGPEKAAASGGSPKHLDTKIKAEYPEIWRALDRIRVYRNDQDHVALYTDVAKRLVTYRTEDLDARAPTEVADVWFLIQQRCLEALRFALESQTRRQTAIR